MLPRSFGTHDGSFHADEVTACSLLLLFNQIDRDKIVRSRKKEILANCDWVCDVGGLYDPEKRRFDHHQAEYKGPMSSAGMVLLHLKTRGVIDVDLYRWLNNVLIFGVDAHDNGRAVLEPGTTSFSQVVSNFMPIEYESPEEAILEAFFQAIDFVVGHLDRLIQRFSYMQACMEVVKQAMAQSNEVLIFNHALPWMENFFELDGDSHLAKFVIMPSGKHWKLRGIPPNLKERMKVRKLLPQSWAGLQEEELQNVTGIKGAIFCHKGRFISIWETKDDALKALQLTMEIE
ncbi:MAG TPA: MYG1 family protein [Chlamydiales bacterium]|nr:MYG1 family protein [Chlamydiales bacterium]